MAVIASTLSRPGSEEVIHRFARIQQREIPAPVENSYCRSYREYLTTLWGHCSVVQGTMLKKNEALMRKACPP